MANPSSLNLVKNACLEWYHDVLELSRDHTPKKAFSNAFYAIAFITLTAVMFALLVPDQEQVENWSLKKVSLSEFLEKKQSLINFSCISLQAVPVNDLFEPTEESHCSYEDWRSQYICRLTEQEAFLALRKMELNGLVLTEKEVLTAVYARLDQVPDDSRTRLRIIEEVKYAEKEAALSNVSDIDALDAEWKTIFERYFKSLELYKNATAIVKRSFAFNHTVYFEKAGIQSCSWKAPAHRIVMALLILNSTNTLIGFAADAYVLVYFIVFALVKRAMP